MTESKELAVRNEAVMSIDEAKSQLHQLQQFVHSVMKEGVDYGVIPHTSDKPVLLKPGAEKLAEIYGLASEVTIEDKIERYDDPMLFAYRIKVTMRSKRTGQIISEGIGSCNSMEKKYRNNNPADIANTILKMAKKRAYIDAVLSATRSSEIFTQDLDEMTDVVDVSYSVNGNNKANGTTNNGSDDTKPTDKQKALINKLLDEKFPSKKDGVEYLVNAGFGSPKTWNKHDTSRAIEHLMGLANYEP